MAAPMLVTGGTGTLGRLVVPRLRSAGCDVRVLSRRAGDFVGDLATGAGVDAAVAGVEVVVHCAGTGKGDEMKARHLVRAATRAGGAAPGVHLGGGRRPGTRRQPDRPG